MFKSLMKAVRGSLDGIDAEDLLYRVGLERRRSAYPKYLLLGLGLVVGAGVGLVLAPKTGRQIRAKIAAQVRKRTGTNGHRKGYNGHRKGYEEKRASSPRM